jgi:hypothetical protein
VLAGCNSDPGQLASPPGAPVVSISPAEPGTADSLEVVIVTDSIDSDGDFAGYRYLWIEDGVERPDLVDSTLVPALVTARGQQWQVQVTPFDQIGHVGPSAAASVSIVNTAPSVAVSIVPNPADTDADLSLESSSEDLDGDPVALTVTWARNGVASSSYDGLLVIPGSFTEEGDDWTVHVLPSDGTEEGEAQVATVHVGNAPPVVSNFSISPATPREGDTLTASATATDPDGDWVTVAYQWFVDGQEVPSAVTTSLRPEHFDKHQEVWAVVVPTDSQGTSGEPVESNHVTVENTPPFIDSVTISPATGGEETVFTCVASGWADPDPADAIQVYAIQWWVQGDPVATTETIDGSLFDKHDELRCRVIASDSDGDGDPRQSDLLEVENTPPTALLVDLVSSEADPSLAYETSTLTAQPHSYADVDPADSIANWQFEWIVDGQSATATGSSITGADFDRNQDVHVVARPYDGEDVGAPMTSPTIEILNTAPSVASVAITPDPAYTNTSLEAVPVGWSDPDDPPSYQYAWTVNGFPAGSDSSQLSLTLFVLGDSVVVTATPDDGQAQGPAVTSLALLISDASPDPALVQILPADPRPGSDNLLCTFTADPLDPDGDPVTHAIGWRLDGTSFPASTTSTTIQPNDTIDASLLATGQDWECAVSSADPQNNVAIATDSVLVRIPDFSLLDLNQTSLTFAQQTSPRDYLGGVSAWYFGDAMDFGSVPDFDCLELVQLDLDANYASLDIQLLGINKVGQEGGNAVMTLAVAVLPWLQDDATADVATSWGASTDELVILDDENFVDLVYDLVQHDPCVAAERVVLRNLLVALAPAGGDDDDSAGN